MKKYITGILSIGTITLLFYTLFDLKNQVKQIPVLQHQLDSVNLEIDSLTMDLFEERANNGRHEITREDFLKVNYPKIYNEYEEYLSTKTE